MVGDYYEALGHYREADALLRVVRAQQLKGANVEVDVILDDLKACVDKTREALEQEAATDVETDRSAGNGSDGLEEDAAESGVAKQEETAAATE